MYHCFEQSRLIILHISSLVDLIVSNISRWLKNLLVYYLLKLKIYDEGKESFRRSHDAPLAEHIKIGLHCNGDISIYLYLYQNRKTPTATFSQKELHARGYHIPHFSSRRLYTLRTLYDRNCHPSLFAYHFTTVTISLLATALALTAAFVISFR
jgi:hypothetical protein